MTRRELSRRDFMKVGLAAAGSGLLASILACGGSGFADMSPVPTSTPRVFELNNGNSFEIDAHVPPEIAFLSMATRYHPDQFRLLTDPIHRDLLSTIYMANAKVARGGFAQLVDEAVMDGNICGLAGCGDSRQQFAKIFPNLIQGNEELNIATGEMANIVGDPVYRVGTQPAVFRKGVNISVFAPHETAACVAGGCGAWGGIETLATNPNALSSLKHHGVSDMVIQELQGLYQQGLDRGLATLTEEDWLTVRKQWAKIGARMQAEMNVNQWGGSHYSAYGIYGHADDSFTTLGVIDNLGNEYAIDDFPKLKAVTSYINQPHAIIDSLAKGQEPMIIGINGSRQHSIPGLFGDLTNESGLLFKSDVDRIAGLPISADEARKVIAGADYGINVLQNKNFVVLVADNADDMAMLRTTLLNEGVEKGSIGAFLQRGGVIIEMIPDKAGRFTGLANVRTAQDLMGDVTKMDFANSATLRSVINIESTFLGQLEVRATRDLELKILTEGQYNKIIRMITFLQNPALRPIGMFAKLGLQFIGDYFAIKGFVEWFNTSLLDENLVYKNATDAVIWKNKTVMTSEEEMRIMVDNGIAHPYLVGGYLDHINLNQADLVKSHAGAQRAWFKHGPNGQEGEEEPWKSLQLDDLGKLITLEIPSPNPYTMPITLITSLVSKPNDENLNGQAPSYSDTNPNQRMMLVDQATEMSVPILGDIPGQNTTISAFDPNNPRVRYYFEVSVPKDNSPRFEFRFVGMGCNAPERAEAPISVDKNNVLASLIESMQMNA